MQQEDDSENRIMRNSQFIFSFVEYVTSMEEIRRSVNTKLWSENLKETHYEYGFLGTPYQVFTEICQLLKKDCFMLLFSSSVKFVMRNVLCAFRKINQYLQSQLLHVRVSVGIWLKLYMVGSSGCSKHQRGQDCWRRTDSALKCHYICSWQISLHFYINIVR